ncbi:MAG TPA: SurA N-terminal domain-containing protein [Thiobacillus sp.]|nr:MAG: peptidylprolyl isomerase [Hydrogenophilales bacterium 16-61-112]OZA44258.1 MAG: peptidylprolyl isomerase [Hydrogenophilales bacterium 17-61-76]HQT31571.1 SurA N-terminal domain-containing protein [Thiobacillus sp.]HQT71084.1 SurA N-terminal domain-containing protein [Thiobacillus sp.]
MLEAIRNHAQGWLAKVLLGLIALSFALFGLDSYMSGGQSNGEIAKVGDVGVSREELARETQGQADRLRESLGPSFDPAVTETAEFRKQVLDGLIDRKALFQDAQKLKIIAPDAYVAAVLMQIPAFQQDGKFSPQRYEAVLRQNNRTPAQFESELRQSFMLETVTSPASLAAFPSATSLNQIARLVAQQREISWVDLPASTVIAQIKLKPDDIVKYYANNKSAFTEPEQLRAEYLVLDRANVAASMTVSDDDISKYYASHKAEFGLPEQRSASHILIAVEKNSDAATRAKARAKANELFKTVKKSPERFAELARSQSQDPGSAAQDGHLGSFGRGMMVKSFDDAVFSMQPNEIRGPVESDFGYHVIRLDGIQAAQTAPLSDVRVAVIDALRKQRAQKIFADLADNFGNLVYENADSLQPAAAATKLTIRQSGWMTAKNASAPFDHPGLLAAVFNTESVKSKQNTEAIEVQPGVLVAARVIEHRPARVRPLAEVRPEIEIRLREEQSARLLAGQGAMMIQSLVKGNEAGQSWSAFQIVGRQPSAMLDATEAKAVFRVAAEKLPAYTGFMRPDGSYRIVRISRVLDAPGLDSRLLSSIEAGVMQAQQQADMQAMLALVKAGQKVKIQPNAIEGR